MQDLYNLAQPRDGAANVVFLLGPPGSGKSGLIIDAMAAATAGSPFRESTRAVGVEPAHGAHKVSLMVHKALMRFNLGHPAETLASGMCASAWMPGAAPAFQHDAARTIAARKLHVLDEVQAMTPLLRQYLLQLRKAHAQATNTDGMSHAEVLRRCPHIFALDPQQSPCREIGVQSVDANGRVLMRDTTVIMPWRMCMDVCGPPSASLRYHFVVLHGQYRMSGLLYRLLHSACALPADA